MQLTREALSAAGGREAVVVASRAYFEAALVIGALGFVSTAAAAKFLLRGEVIE